MLIFAGVEEKWLVVATLEKLDEANIKSVVSGRVSIYNPDDEVRYRAVQQCRPGAAYKTDIRVFCCSSREVVAQCSLVFRKYANAVSPGSRENPVHVGTIVERYQYKRRIERNGHKCVRGHAMRFSVLQRSDNGNASREPSQRIPKLAQVENLSSHGRFVNSEVSMSASNLPMLGLDLPMMFTS